MGIIDVNTSPRVLVRIIRKDVATKIDLDDICGIRLVRAPALPFENDLVVYQAEDQPGARLSCSPGEQERWNAAARTYLDALSDAYVELCRAHGVPSIRINLRTGSTSWTRPPRPRRLPGWRGRAVRRSDSAQRQFMARVEVATGAYRPVRQEIEVRLDSGYGSDAGGGSNGGHTLGGGS